MQSKVGRRTSATVSSTAFEYIVKPLPRKRKTPAVRNPVCKHTLQWQKLCIPFKAMPKICSSCC